MANPLLLLWLEYLEATWAHWETTIANDFAGVRAAEPPTFIDWAKDERGWLVTCTAAQGGCAGAGATAPSGATYFAMITHQPMMLDHASLEEYNAAAAAYEAGARCLT